MLELTSRNASPTLSTLQVVAGSSGSIQHSFLLGRLATIHLAAAAPHLPGVEQPEQAARSVTSVAMLSVSC